MNSKLTVLCVDSHSAVLSTTSTVLRNAGYTVLTAGNTAEAMRAIAYIRFDAVILDPFDLRPESVLDALQAFTPETPVLWVVNPWDAATLTESICRPAMFIKPLDPRQLLNELGVLIHQRQTKQHSTAPVHAASA